MMLCSRCCGNSCLCYITCYLVVPSPLLCLNVHLAGLPRDVRAQTVKLRLLLYLPLLVLLPKHLRKGTWTRRTITTNGSLLQVVGANLRTPWLLSGYWQGSLTSKPKSWMLCCATCKHRMMLDFHCAKPPFPGRPSSWCLTARALIKLQAWQSRRQWRWATCYTMGCTYM